MARKQYKYDFNIIHHRTDDRKDEISQFVKFIATVLEGPETKGFYPARDFLPGRNLFDENIRLMDVSRCVIIVVDEAFLKDGWSKYLKQLTLKTKLDDNDGESVIPVSFCVGPHDIKKRCKPLKCQDFVYFSHDYRDDRETLEKLRKAVNEGAPIPDEQIMEGMSRIVEAKSETALVKPGHVVSYDEPESGSRQSLATSPGTKDKAGSQMSGVSMFDRSNVAPSTSGRNIRMTSKAKNRGPIPEQSASADHPDSAVGSETSEDFKDGDSHAGAKLTSRPTATEDIPHADRQEEEQSNDEPTDIQFTDVLQLIDIRHRPKGAEGISRHAALSDRVTVAAGGAEILCNPEPSKEQDSHDVISKTGEAHHEDGETTPKTTDNEGTPAKKDNQQEFSWKSYLWRLCGDVLRRVMDVLVGRLIDNAIR